MSVILLGWMMQLPSGADGQRRARASPGSLLVTGEPAGAEVYLDGELVGVLPLTGAISVPAGSHTVRVTNPGYTEFNQVVEMRRNRELTVEAVLFPISMSLLVSTAIDGAQVFVDGNFAGETPVTLELLDGPHAIRVARFGYYEQLFEVTALAGSAETRELTLQPLPEEERARLEEAPTEWYEEPLPWALVGGGLAAVAVGVVVVVLVTSDDSTEKDVFCAEGQHDCFVFEVRF